MTHRGGTVRLRQLLAVFAFLALTFVAQEVLAAAGPPGSGGTQPTPTPAARANAPSNAQGGVNTLVQPPPIQGQSKPMLFEKYGPLDYGALTTSIGLSDANVINDEGNGEAMAEATAMYLLGIVTARIVEWCFSLNLVSTLGPSVDQFSQGLENSLYQSFLPFILLLAAIVAGWTLLVMRRFLGGLTGLLWAGFTISLAVQLFASPASYLETADQFASGITNAIVVGVAQENPGAPPGSYQQASGDANYEVRLLANRLWTVSVYDPWTMIEFGTVDPIVTGNHQLGIDLLNKNDGQSNTYDQDIQLAPQWIQQWADGNWGVPRAMFGLLLVALGGILLVFTLVIALTVIVGTLTAIVLACLTVPVWLLAPIPGFGQRLLVSWFGGIFAGLAVSTVGALYLVLVLTLLGAVQQLEGQVGLITVGLLDVGLIVVALWLRKTFFRWGKHVARLPLTALGQPLPTPPSRQKGRTRVAVYRQSQERRRVPVPMARWAGAAGGGSGAAAAGAGAATAATAGTALMALTAAKAAQGAAHAPGAARRRLQLLAERAVAGATRPRRLPPHHEAQPQQVLLLPGRNGGPPQQLLLPGRVGETGMRSYRGRRVDLPTGHRAAAAGGGVGASAPRRVAGTSHRGKWRRVGTARS